jgi:nucleotidyltransferase/DNA polymerase involved in DNA repair
VLAARLARPSNDRAPAAFASLDRSGLGELPLTLLPADPATRQRFTLFGLTTFGQLAALPRSAVGAQFGAAGERLQQLTRGNDPRPLVPRRRPERLTAERTFEPPLSDVGAAGLALRALATELVDRLRDRHLAPGRAALELGREDAPALRIELAFPQPALEPDWIARLLLSRLEAVAQQRGGAQREEPRITRIGLQFDRLSNPQSRQLAAFEPQSGKWEELRWSLERLQARFGDGRLWRAEHVRPNAARPELRARLGDIGR